MLKLIKDGLKEKAAYIGRLVDRNVFLKDGVAESKPETEAKQEQ